MAEPPPETPVSGIAGCSAAAVNTAGTSFEDATAAERKAAQDIVSDYLRTLAREIECVNPGVLVRVIR